MDKKVQMNPTIKEQILMVRDDGRTNMFDVNGVMSIANELDCFELVCYLMDKEHVREYSNFIMYGD